MNKLFDLTFEIKKLFRNFKKVYFVHFFLHTKLEILLICLSVFAFFIYSKNSSYLTIHSPNSYKHKNGLNLEKTIIKLTCMF